MTQLSDIYIMGGARTAIGTFGGSLAAFRPADLGSIVIREALSRAGMAAEMVEQVAIGTVVPTQPSDAYVSRVAAVNAGVPVEAVAMNVNRLCGSGLQAIVSVAQAIRLGECDIAIGGGAEVMSNAPRMVQGTRFGQKLGDMALQDMMLGALHDPFENIHMGVTAENIAERCQITREEQDALAVESHKRAARAIAEGRFKEQIVPVEIRTRKTETLFDTDEHVRPEVSLEALAGLKPVFRTGGTVTAGNASGINDGAAAVVLASGQAVNRLGLQPFARVLGWGHAGVAPNVMGLGPVKAVPVALERAGLTLDQIDVIEANEAFAAQACGVASQLGFDPEKTNINGSGISLGHPIGATGAILTVKTLYELRRTDGRYGLITMCIGGGQGLAMVIENCE
ncbi:acetyl-CoA C-acyltransferase family protein [Sphingobium sp. Cam5-1]|uniref:acetyl-CoA C-acyltransferase family protein n=1 Tax=Sphingobium sp. Cam5-1 TaxID=2789327 RepID=UPI0018AD2EA0|nr:acetyl-CoA C-acyltransferase family protein [Sphingobium sp. Cam5-1]QPI72241.1 acetyl-CoA C-acyltransferase family protein [Sphingobium sp. Cam5-1]